MIQDGSSHCPTCTCRKKAPKSTDDDDDDKFSELPDHLLRRILSFLDSYVAVRTCLLSRRWRSIWKGVPALNLYARSFATDDDFAQFVSGILSRRHDSASIEEVSLQPCRLDEIIGGRLFDYAAGVGVGVGDRFSSSASSMSVVAGD